MRAAVLTEIGKPFVIRDDLSLDQPIGREILVDVKASGLCHSDLYVATHEMGMPLPLVLGHEVAGVVRQIGPDVTEFKVGDHIVACLAGFCGRCDRCATGRPNLCRGYPSATQRSPDMPPRMRLGGEPIAQFSEISGFAEQILIHENNAVVVPDELPFQQAAIMGCAVTTGAGAAINSASVKAGENVAVIGCGGVGLNVVQGAALVGARKVIAIDVDTAKLDLARGFGATHVINAKRDDPVNAVRALTGGGVDHAFEVVGSLQETLSQAVEMLDVGGTAYIVGAQAADAIFELHPAQLLYAKTSLKGVFMGGANFKQDIPFFAELYLQQRFNLDDLISRTIALDEINDAYRDLKCGGVARSVITSF